MTAEAGMAFTKRKWTLMGAPLGRVYVSAGPSIGGPDGDGIGVEVEVVPASQLQEAVEALHEAARQLDLAAMRIVDRDDNQRVKQAAVRARTAAGGTVIAR